MQRLLLGSMLFLTFVGCAADGATGEPSDAPVEDDSQDQKTSRGGGRGGGRKQAEGDGSFACVDVQNGFGATQLRNDCGASILFSYCVDADVGTPNGILNDCLQAHTISLEPGQSFGITRGHSSAGDPAHYYASCLAPSAPAPNGADLRLGYTCP